MKIQEIMTAQPDTIEPDARIEDAAVKMKTLNVGAIPVSQRGRLSGIITDRDIAVRVVAERRDPASTRVREVMSEPAVCCLEDQPIEEVSRLMREHQVRRIPVTNRDQQIVGMVSLGDLAVKAGEQDTLRSVSQPARPAR